MDYSLLVGIHDVERAEQEEVESEDNEAEEEGESDGGGIGTPPDSPSNTLDSTKPLSPGEFDPTIDVYAIKSNESEYPVPFKGYRRTMSKYDWELPLVAVVIHLLSVFVLKVLVVFIHSNKIRSLPDPAV